MASEAPTLNVPLELRARLSRLAETTHRDLDVLAAQAIQRFVEIEEWQIQGIQLALDDDRPGIPHDQIVAWLESLGTDTPLPPPQPPPGKVKRR